MIVVDIDVQTGGLKALAVWRQAHGELPKTPTVRTPTGGLHLYFKYPVDMQVVVPPSVRTNGGKYVWLEPLTTPSAEVPGWLLDIIAIQRLEGGTSLDDA